MSAPRIAVRVLVDDHTHRGRRCARGAVIDLRPDQVQWLGLRVQRLYTPQAVADAGDDVTLPAAPERDDSEGGSDNVPDDPDPEPEPEDEGQPAGGAAKHRQQGVSGIAGSPLALTLHTSLTGADT